MFGSFLGNKEGNDLPLLQGHGGEILYLFGVDETVISAVILDWQLQLITHEIDITLHRFIRNLEVVGESLAIREFAFLKKLMDLEHPVHGQACRTSMVLSGLGRFDRPLRRKA